MKLFNYLFIIVGVLFGAMNLTAQTFLNYTGDLGNEGFSQMEYIDNGITRGYYAIGYHQTPGDDNSRVATLTHLDEFGNYQWTRTYGTQTWFVSMAYNQSTQELMLCGFRGLTGPTRQIITTKVDLNGALTGCGYQELTRPNPTTNGIRGLKMIKTNEAVETYIIMSWWNTGSSVDDLSLAKIDSCGIPIWWNDYDGGDDQFSDLAPWANGGCVVVGNTSGTGWRSTLLPVDASGNAQPAISYGTGMGHFNDIDLLPNGDYITCGNSGQGGNTEDAYVAYLDANFNAVWVQEYATAASETMRSVVEINGAIYAGNYLPDGGGRKLHLSKFDLSGGYQSTKMLDISYETSHTANASLSAGQGNLLTLIDRRSPTAFGGTWDVVIGAIDPDGEDCEVTTTELPFMQIDWATGAGNTTQSAAIYEPISIEGEGELAYEQLEVCPPECGEMIIDSLSCNPDGSYNITFHLVNHTPYVVLASFFSGVQPAGTFSPQFMNVNIPASGGVSPTYSTVFTPTTPIIGSIQQCFSVSFFNLDNDVCCHFEHCVELEECSPCDEEYLSLDARPTVDTTDGCCYIIDVTNNWSANYFTKIKTTITTPGVEFGQTAGSFTSTPQGTLFNELDWTNPPTIPLGTTTNAIEFCFTNLTSWTQANPQVVFDWYALDSLGNEVVVCTDTLTFECEPCVLIEEENIVCLPDGTFDYTFTIKNNTQNSTSGPHTIDVVAILFANASLVINPSPTQWNVTLNPGDTYTQTINISGGNPGDVVDFKFLLIDGNIDVFDWCCHTNHSITLPDCEPNVLCPEVTDYNLTCTGDEDGDGIFEYDLTITTTGSGLMDVSGNGTFNPTSMPLPGPTQTNFIQVTNVTGNTLSVFIQLYDDEQTLCDSLEIILDLPPCDAECPFFLEFVASCDEDIDGDGDIDHRLELYFDGVAGFATITSPDATISPANVPTNGASPEIVYITNPTTNPITYFITLVNANGEICDEQMYIINLEDCEPELCPDVIEFDIQCIEDVDGDGAVDYEITLFTIGTGSVQIFTDDATLTPNNYTVSGGVTQVITATNVTNNVINLVLVYSQDGAICVEEGIGFDVPICPFVNPIDMSLAVYPNPATTALQVTIPPAMTSEKQLVIYDLHGKIEQQLPVAAATQTMEVNINDLSEGVYFLQIQDKTGAIQQMRFVKMK